MWCTKPHSASALTCALFALAFFALNLEDGTRTASAGGEHTYIDTCIDDSREIYLFLNRLSNFCPEGTIVLHFQMRI